MQPRRVFGPALAAVFALSLVASPQALPAGETDCEQEFDSTFALIQKAIFENKGCTSAACHDRQTAQGGLDLSPEVAYDNLVDQPVESVPAELYPGLKRVIPGRKADSLLWLNLASATLPDQWQAPLRPMPLGLPPLTVDELEAVRLWIEEGATRNGVVAGTGELLNACLPPPSPLEVEPLPPPPPGTGVQIRAPHQVLPANREREVCFISYFDLTDQVPEEFLSPDGRSFRFKNLEARQDPHSHHAVVIVYKGTTDIHDPVWGPFACRGGERDGEACEPTDLGACGADALCASPPTPSLACIGFGPGDAGIGVAEDSLFNTMSSSAGDVDGVYDEAPLKGILVWNSHAFNLTDREAKLDMWINFEFAKPEEQLRKLRRLVDVSAISKMNPPAYGVDEVCHAYVAPPNAEFIDMSSHEHKRGKRFRVFQGAFTCEGGPNHGDPCSPFGPDPGLPLRDLCSGSPCTSRLPPRIGDCNRDMQVTIDELVTGVGIALELTPMSACPASDGNKDGSVSVSELVGCVNAAAEPEFRDAGESLIYSSFTYVDPTVVRFEPRLVLGGGLSTRAQRTLTYCGLYDNGFTNPDEVKRNSQTPANGRPCHPTHCAEGAVGRPCVGSSTAERDRSCDSSAGSGDGFCDACSAGFGVSTEDEMFVLTGTYLLD
jgi:hypothetical protein